MRKINKQFIVKSLIFISGVYTWYKMATKTRERDFFNDQDLLLKEKNARELINDVMKQTEL